MGGGLTAAEPSGGRCHRRVVQGPVNSPHSAPIMWRSTTAVAAVAAQGANFLLQNSLQMQRAWRLGQSAIFRSKIGCGGREAGL
jgi:hypothetical protein